MCVHVCVFNDRIPTFYVGARGSDIFPVYGRANNFEYSVEEKFVARKER